MPEKTPADHKSANEGFSFTIKGKKYRLPKVTEDAAGRVPGGITADALDTEDEWAQTRLGWALLKECEPKPEAMAALRSLPTSEMFEIVGNWLGEQDGSSN